MYNEEWKKTNYTQEQKSHFRRARQFVYLYTKYLEKCSEMPYLFWL